MNAGRLFVGVVLLGIGAMYLLEGAEVLDASETVADWWPTALIALGLFHAVDHRRFTAVSAGLVISGALLLTVTTDLLGDESWDIVWPLALIWAGAWLAFGWGRRAVRRTPDIDSVDGIAVLSASRVATR